LWRYFLVVEFDDIVATNWKGELDEGFKLPASAGLIKHAFCSWEVLEDIVPKLGLPLQCLVSWQNSLLLFIVWR
jgi:hypothetical protein